MTASVSSPFSAFSLPHFHLQSLPPGQGHRHGRLQVRVVPTPPALKSLTSSSIIASIIGIAGAGFRLSLVLNAVGVGMATADVEIQSIARAISEYAFTLKQLALTLDSAKSIATQSAMETAKQIADQSQLVFDDIKAMTELNQKKDDRGHLQSIAVEQRVRWCFKKQRLNYLLGQLESLKLSLSIMLQILQMGQSLIHQRYGRTTSIYHQVLTRSCQQRRRIHRTTKRARNASGASRNTEHGRREALVTGRSTPALRDGRERGYRKEQSASDRHTACTLQRQHPRPFGPTAAN